MNETLKRTARRFVWKRDAALAAPLGCRRVAVAIHRVDGHGYILPSEGGQSPVATSRDTGQGRLGCGGQSQAQGQSNPVFVAKVRPADRDTRIPRRRFRPDQRVLVAKWGRS